MRNQLDNGLKGRERLATPIDGNVRKEPMLDLVPFAGGRRQVANGDGQAGLISQVLHLLLPQPIARPIGATPISHDQQFPTSGIQFAAHALPPASDALDGKLCGLMVDADRSRSRCFAPDHRCYTEWLSRPQWKGNHTHSRSCLALWLAMLSRHSCALPISSFFLQSTEMTGWPLASKALPVRLLC